MKQNIYSLIAALALCGSLTGCDGLKCPLQKKNAVPTPPAEVAAPAAVEASAAVAVPAAVEVAAAPALASVEAALPAIDATTVVAKVNGKDITEGDIQKVLAMFMKQMAGQIPPDQMKEALLSIRERILDELIMRSVVLDEVTKQGIRLSDAEFNADKADMAKELPQGATLESYMAETGTTETEMREQMAARKMIMAIAEKLAKPSAEEIQAYYDKNKESFNQGESVNASHILIKVDPTEDDAAKTAKRARIEGLRKQLLEGADFKEIAKANSDCPSASGGGDLGAFGRGQMVPAFEEAAFTQPVGKVGEVIETQFGYHLILVSGRTEAKVLEFKEVQSDISDTLDSQKKQDAVREFVDGLRAKAAIQRFDKAAAPVAGNLLQMDGDAGTVEKAPDAVVTPVKVTKPPE